MFRRLTSEALFFMWAISTLLPAALLLAALLLAACSGAPAPQVTPTPVEEPAATSSPAAEPTVTPTPIEEPMVTSTPVAEPTTAPTPLAETETGDNALSGTHTYLIVPEESKASYVVDEEFFADALTKYGIQAGLTDTIGSTQEIEGELQLNLDDLSAPLGVNRFSVNLATLTSNQPLRDRWIRQNGPQFNTFPMAEFTATAIEDAPDTYTQGEEVNFKLVGDLTIREITQPVTFDVTAKLGDNSISGVATAQLRMTDFGIEPPNFANTLTVGNDFEVQVEFTAREQ